MLFENRKLKRKGFMWGFIVKAALALFVFVILFILISSKFGLFDEGLKSCEAKNGYCVEEKSQCSGTVSIFQCQNKEMLCCIPNS